METYRVRELKTFGEKVNADLFRYLEDKELLLDYLIDENYNDEKGNIMNTYNGMYKDCFYRYTYNNYKLSDKDKLINYKGKQYIIYTRKTIKTIYEVLPKIYDDEVFAWKDNAKYKTKECTIKSGNFEFLIKYFNSLGNATVDIIYNKLNNRHRNKITISDYEIKNATNESIVNSIQEWLDILVDDISDVNI